MEYILWLLSMLVAMFIGGYLKSYLSQKGANLATHEDIGKLVEQMTAITQATKQIEGRISDEIWNRQRHWEMKREAIVAAIQALLEADDALESLARALRLEIDMEHVSERCRKCIAIIDAVKAKRVLALIVCGRDFSGALSEMYETLRLAAGKLGDRNLKGYEESAPVLRKNFARAIFFARREIGMEWQSTASSGVPNLAGPK